MKKLLIAGAVAVLCLAGGVASAAAPPVDTATRAHVEAAFAEWLTTAGISFAPASIACALTGQDGTALGLCYANSEATGVLGYATITMNSGETWVFTDLEELGDEGDEASATGDGAAATTTASFGDGTWLVGADIEPGTYRTDAPDWCYWERLSGLGGELSDIIANDNAMDGGQVIVEIRAGDAAFHAEGCGTWERID